MKKYSLLMFLLCFTQGIMCVAAPSDNESLRVATYNVRREGKEKKDIKSSWAQRKIAVFELIADIAPDVIGFQEVVRSQFDDLIAAMGGGYGSFGESRSSKKRGLMQHIAMKYATNEYCPIFYNKKRLTCLSSGTFGVNPRNRLLRAWLPRICTWGLFEDRHTGEKLYIFNVHLDNNKNAHRLRAKQIKKIITYIAENTHGLPVILLGDLNTALDGKVQKELMRGGFIAARNNAEIIIGPMETRTGWYNSKLKIIDHILYKSSMARVARYEVVLSQEGIFPSDHRPVYTDIVVS